MNAISRLWQLVLFVALLVAGCASPPRSTLDGAPPPAPPRPREQASPPAGFQPAPARQLRPAPAESDITAGPARTIVDAALAQIGTPYAYGGNGTPGFDCSGLVKHCYSRAGIRVPRTTRELAKVGKRVAGDDIRPGDVLLFADDNGRVSHAGIWIGQGRFVHASTSRGVVRDALDSSWFRARYIGARRVLQD